MPNNWSPVTIRAQWTPDMDAVLRENYQTKTLKEIAPILGLKPQQVYSRMERLGLSKDRKIIRNANIEPLMKLSEIDMAYFTGLMDGEGTFSCQVRTTPRRIYLRPWINVTNTSLDLMDWLIDMGLSVTLGINNTGKPYWKAQASGVQIAPVIRRMQPYAKIRPRRYELTAQIAEQYATLGRTQNPTPHIMSMYEELRALNMRGSSLQDELHRNRALSTSPLLSSALLRLEL